MLTWVRERSGHYYAETDTWTWNISRSSITGKWRVYGYSTVPEIFDTLKDAKQAAEDLNPLITALVEIDNLNDRLRTMTHEVHIHCNKTTKDINNRMLTNHEVEDRVLRLNGLVLVMAQTIAHLLSED